MGDNKLYEKIINLPHKTSKNRKRMSMHDRAAQFSAFAALTGYGDEIAEKARLTDSKTYITEDAAFIINERINRLLEREKERPRVTITRFVKDKLKSGGKEEEMSVTVRRVDTVNRQIITDKNEKIAIDDITFIAGEIF